MKLFHLDPIGLGTSEAESLPSYIHRLSILHGVTVGQLLERIEKLAGRTNAPYRNSPVLAQFVRPNQTTQAIVEDLEKVTDQTGLAALTLLPLSDCLARDMSCYSKDMRWCPTCLGEQRVTGGVAYYKLVWHFADVKTCHLHRAPIERVCGHCGRHQNTLKVRVCASICQFCRKPHEAGRGGARASNFSWQNDAFDLCQLAADMKGYANTPPKSSAPVEFLDSVFDYYWFAERERELYARVDHHEMLSILHGETPITLRTLRKYAFQLGLAIDSFLCSDAPYEPAFLLKQSYLPESFKPASRQKRDHEATLDRIQQVLAEAGPGISLRRLAERAGVSAGYISHRLPHVKRKVVDERRAHQVREKERKRQEAIAAAFEYLTRDDRLFIKSKKQALRVLRRETGLPKNVLREAIGRAFEKALPEQGLSTGTLAAVEA